MDGWTELCTDWALEWTDKNLENGAFRIKLRSWMASFLCPLQTRLSPLFVSLGEKCNFILHARINGTELPCAQSSGIKLKKFCVR